MEDHFDLKVLPLKVNTENYTEQTRLDLSKEPNM